MGFTFDLSHFGILFSKSGMPIWDAIAHQKLIRKIYMRDYNK